MTKTEYREYLASPHWKETRKKKLQSQTECNHCGIDREYANLRDGQDLNVHHLTYANLWHERPEDLEVLCLRCHQLEHGVGPADYCYKCDVPLYGAVTGPPLCGECSQTHKFVRLADSPYVGLFGLLDGQNPDELVIVEVSR